MIGGGEHARVVIEAARSQREAWRLLGVVDRDPAARTTALLDVAHLGDDDDLLATLSMTAPDERPWLIIGFGGGAADAVRRAAAVTRFGQGSRWATLSCTRPRGSPPARRWVREPWCWPAPW